MKEMSLPSLELTGKLMLGGASCLMTTIPDPWRDKATKGMTLCEIEVARKASPDLDPEDMPDEVKKSFTVSPDELSEEDMRVVRNSVIALVGYSLFHAGFCKVAIPAEVVGKVFLGLSMYYRSGNDAVKPVAKKGVSLAIKDLIDAHKAAWEAASKTIALFYEATSKEDLLSKVGIAAKKEKEDDDLAVRVGGGDEEEVVAEGGLIHDPVEAEGPDDDSLSVQWKILTDLGRKDM